MLHKDKNTPTVSVVVPVKNGAQKIRSLLESLLKVEYPTDRLEIMVVDGGSTDGTREIVSEFSVSLLDEEGHGLNAARNTGIKHSTGEIIAFTDSDCVVPQDWIRKVAANFSSDDVGCSGGNAVRFYDDFLSRYSDESIIPVLRVFKRKEMLCEVQPPSRYPAGCNMAIRRKVLDETGVFDESVRFGFDEDELVERICKKGYKMILDPEVVIKHKHRSSVSELLKLNFNYGRGIGLLLRTKGLGSTFSKWILLSIWALTIWVAVMMTLIFSSIATRSLVPLTVLFVFFILPFSGLSGFYAHKTVKLGDRGFGRMLKYPFLDIARSITFVFGSIYQLLKPVRKATKA